MGGVIMTTGESITVKGWELCFLEVKIIKVKFTYLVAMPEHLARVLRATLSPRSTFLTGPLTVAQCFTASKVSPSWMCHSTLKPAISGLYDDRNVGDKTHVQSSCLNTSSKNGTPANTP